MIDPIYTPASLAKEMVDSVQIRKPKLVADFAVGGGELLRAAEARWSRARFHGSDLDRHMIASLHSRHRQWSLLTRDFLADDCADAEYPRPRTVDVILLNPPFSCRGGKSVTSFFADEKLKVSVAIAFLLRAEPLLSPRGEMVIVLPSGSLHSEKDARAWELLRSKYECTTIRAPSKGMFPSHAPSIAVLRLSAPRVKHPSSSPSLSCRTMGDRTDVELLRGKIQMHRLAEHRSGLATVNLIHSTNLRGGELSGVGAVQVMTDSIIKGPCVLVPRVGAPSLQKIVSINAHFPVALSDCVFALRCRTQREQKLLNGNLAKNWPLLASMYQGTGAPFLTVVRLRQFLERNGYQVQVVKSMERTMARRRGRQKAGKGSSVAKQ